MPTSSKTMLAGAAAALVALAACERKPAPAAPAPTAPTPASAPLAAPPAPSPAEPSQPLPPPVALPRVPHPAAPPPAFSLKAARLAVIPPGHELGETVFSADGRHVAFVTSQGGNAYVHLDGTQARPFESVRGLTFGERTGTLAFVARRGTKEAVVLDGREGTRFTEIGSLHVTRDGRAVHSAKRGEAWGVVAGQRELAVLLETDPEPIPSPDGRRVVFRDRSPETGRAVVRSCTLELDGCQAGGSYDALSSPVLDATGVRAAFLASRDGKETVVVVDLDRPDLGERTLGAFDAVAMVALSEGGEHVAFLASRGDQQLLVRNGQEAAIPRTDSPMVISVSRTGRVVVVAMRGGKATALLDGKPTGPGLDELAFPAFSVDGLRLAYVAGGPTMNLLVVEGAQGPVYDKVVTPRFMPVGTGVVYRARRKEERFVVQANARGQTIREHPHYQAVFDVLFSPDGRQVGYGVRQGQELWWKVERLEQVTPG